MIRPNVWSLSIYRIKSLPICMATNFQQLLESGKCDVKIKPSSCSDERTSCTIYNVFFCVGCHDGVLRLTWLWHQFLVVTLWECNYKQKFNMKYTYLPFDDILYRFLILISIPMKLISSFVLECFIYFDDSWRCVCVCEIVHIIIDPSILQAHCQQRQVWMKIIADSMTNRMRCAAPTRWQWQLQLTLKFRDWCVFRRALRESQHWD